MKTTINVILIALIAIVFHVSGFATESGTMICKGGIVSIRDTSGEVISKCGQPASITQREQKQVDRSKDSRGRTITSISISDWIFNFGRDQFQYQLLLENGRVARIESLGYGY